MNASMDDVTPFASSISEDSTIFQTDIRVLRWQTEAGFNERLSERCLALYESKIKNKMGFRRYNIWQETIPELVQLKKMFASGMTSYIETFFKPEITDNFNYEMHGWLRIDNPKQIIPPHNHGGSHLVATYYSQVDITDRKVVPTGYAESLAEGDLVLMDPRQAFLARFYKGAGQFSISPEVGMMVIIPNYLMHWVNPVSSGDVRICIANNMQLRKKNPLPVEVVPFIKGNSTI